MSKATCIVHWPGESTPACDHHAAKLIALAKIMGFTLTRTPAAPDDECANCKGEKRER